jgi:hypothetical protein
MCFTITDIVRIRIGANFIFKIDVPLNTAIFGFCLLLVVCLLKVFVFLLCVCFRCLHVEFIKAVLLIHT